MNIIFKFLLQNKKNLLAKSLKDYHKINLNMNEAHLRLNENSQLSINFHYKNEKFRVDRDFNFCRSFNECIDIFLERAKNNIEKEFTKKLKKKKKKNNDEKLQDEAELSNLMINVDIMRNNECLHNISFKELLIPYENVSTDLVLRILNDDFKIFYNSPWVIKLELPNSILAGFMLYPSKIELQHAQYDSSRAVWYRGLMPKPKNVEQIEWKKIHEGLLYTTNNNDIGHHIKLEFLPKNHNIEGVSTECISKNEVQPNPGKCPFENRHIFTKCKLNGDEFRIVSYNILANFYADSDFSRKELFPYCPPYALDIDYRKQLIIKEILGYNSDIICLQEVDEKVFCFDFVRVLGKSGYQGIFRKKGKTNEGLSIFLKTERFEILEDHSFNIGENLQKLEYFENLWKKIKVHEKLTDKILNLATVLQVVLVKLRDTSNFILLANTHLYFHPNADNIRLLQCAFCMIYLENLYNKIKKYEGVGTLSILFCGDFNSSPENGIYKLMTEKFVDENFFDWQSSEDEIIKDVILINPFNIQSAYGCPKYTNYTSEFKGCLDYIFYMTDYLEVKQVVPLPTEEELSCYIAIPSVVSPSDHLSLIADFKYRNEK